MLGRRDAQGQVDMSFDTSAPQHFAVNNRFLDGRTSDMPQVYGGDRSPPHLQSSATVSSPAAIVKPDLNVQADSPDFNSSGTALTDASPHNWQQPYRELSRFPSASYRSRGKDWPPDGARFMTPLPSPLDFRSRSFSDSADEASSVEGELTATPASNAPIAARRTNLALGIKDQRVLPTRTRTANFFDTMDAAFSPPPPPRMPSANYDHYKRKSLDGPALSTPIKDLNLLPLHTSPQPDFQRLSLSASMPASRTRSSSITNPPLSNLFSVSHSEQLSRSPPSSASFLPSHRRVTSNGSASTTPTRPSALGRHTVVSQSPLPSPTESQSSHWLCEPPNRLPMLLPDAPINGANSYTTSLASPLHDTAMSRLQGQKAEILSGASRPSESENECMCGSILDGRYEILRDLGLGAFSKVVLAKRLARLSPTLDTLPDAHWASRSQVQSQGLEAGLRDIAQGHARLRSIGLGIANKLQHSTGVVDTIQRDQKGQQTEEDLVAIKLIDRDHIRKNDRMRISIMREVEVLKVSFTKPV